MSKSMDIHIRSATADDAEILAKTISLAYRDVASRFGITPQNAPTHPSNAESHWILSDLENGISYLIAEENDSCVGCVAYSQSGPELEAQRLAVIPSRRGGNVAKLLNEAIYRIAKLSHAETIRIAIVADHRSLQRWYERMGFRACELCTFEHLPFEVQYLELDVSKSRDESGA